MGESRRHTARVSLSRGLALAVVGASLLAGCVSGPIAGSAPPTAVAVTTGAPSVAIEPPASTASLDARSAEGGSTPASSTGTPTPTPTRTPSPTPSPTPARPAPAPASAPFVGFFALGAVVQGPGEFRIGTTDWYIEVPAGMRLRWDYVSDADAQGVVRWGWSDVESGSQMVVTSSNVTDVARVLTGESAARGRASRNFDAVIASVSRQSSP